MTALAKLLEAALFASAHPVAIEDLRAMVADDEASAEDVTAALEEIRLHYDEDGHGVELMEVAGGWQVLTRPEFTEVIERAQLAARPQRLSAPALETLAIIAYRQPIGRAEIEEIRGVGAGQMLKSLHERELIEVVGRGEGMGRPLLYGTTPLFLEQFALRHLGELPRGVGAGQMLKSLHERELIEVVRRGEGMGRPLLYGTTPLFLEQFALRHLGELPRGDELAIALRDPNAPPLTSRNESEVPREREPEPLQLAGSDDEPADANTEQHRLADAQA